MIIMLHPKTGLGVLTPTKACPKLATDCLQAAAVSNKAPAPWIGQSGGAGRVSRARGSHSTPAPCVLVRSSYSHTPQFRGRARVSPPKAHRIPSLSPVAAAGTRRWPRVPEVQQRSLQGSFPSLPSALPLLTHRTCASPRSSDFP